MKPTTRRLMIQKVKRAYVRGDLPRLISLSASASGCIQQEYIVENILSCLSCMKIIASLSISISVAKSQSRERIPKSYELVVQGNLSCSLGSLSGSPITAANPDTSLSISRSQYNLIRVSASITTRSINGRKTALFFLQRATTSYLRQSSCHPSLESAISALLIFKIHLTNQQRLHIRQQCRLTPKSRGHPRPAKGVD